MRRVLVWCAVVAVLICSSSVQAKNLWRLTDINPGSAGSYPSYMTIYDGDIYFRANDEPSGNDVELWRYDGTDVTQVADIVPGPVGSSPAYLADGGAYLYFSATDPVSGTIKLFRSDGATTGLAPGWSGSLPQNMVLYNGVLVYNQAHFNTNTDLWKYDGAAQAGIYKVGGGNVLGPQGFAEFGGQLYFSAASSGGGAELWRTNGTTAVQLTTILAPSGGSSPAHLTAYGDALYFAAYDGVNGNELWRYVPSTNTAELVADIRPGGQYASGNPGEMVVYDGKLYFAADDGVHGSELWAWDGTTAVMVAEINPTPDPGNGDTYLMDSNPHLFIVYEEKIYFIANDGAHGNEVWSWDGTKAELEWDIYPGQYSSEITEMIVFTDGVYVDADDGIHGRELWRMQFPEPATMGLLALGGLGVLVRRRRA
jgi:ELWxxDGT repeat protein